MDDDKTLAMVDALRKRGAIEVTVGAVSAKFATPSPESVAVAPKPKQKTEAELQAEHDAILFASAG